MSRGRERIIDVMFVVLERNDDQRDIDSDKTGVHQVADTRQIEACAFELENR